MARFSILAVATALLPSATMAFISTTSHHTTTNTALSAKNAQDQPRTAPSWTQSRPVYNDDFDAPIPANPQSGTTVLENEPVVDDECYMGANGEFDDCVDFDPPKQANLWTNVLDTPRGQEPRDLPGWAKQK